MCAGSINYFVVVIVFGFFIVLTKARSDEMRHSCIVDNIDSLSTVCRHVRETSLRAG